MSTPDTEPTPIVFDDSMTTAQIRQFLSATAFVVTSIPVFAALFSRRDIVGIVDLLKSEPALQAIGVLSAFALLVYRQWATRRRVAKGTVIAAASPVAVLKSEVAGSPTPSAES